MTGPDMDPANIPAEKRLGHDDTFNFECRPDLECFNTCCGNKVIPLWPIDVIELKNGLGLDSDKFLDKHAGMMPDPDTGWPMITLGLMENGRCPFVGPDGCSVYDHRPAACRLYPLGRAVKVGASGLDDEFHYVIEAPACRGLGQPKTWTVQAWNDDQGLIERQAAAIAFERTLFPKGRKGLTGPNERQIQAVIMAAYNVDVFRAFVFTGGFLDRFDVDQGRLEAVRNDDPACLELGLDWLKHALHGAATLEVKSG